MNGRNKNKKCVCVCGGKLKVKFFFLNELKNQWWWEPKKSLEEEEEVWTKPDYTMNQWLNNDESYRRKKNQNF